MATPRYLRYPIAAALAATTLLAAAPPFVAPAQRPATDPCRKHAVSWYYGDDATASATVTRTSNGATLQTHTRITPDAGGPFPGPLEQLGERTGTYTRSSAKDCVTKIRRDAIDEVETTAERP